MANPWDVDTTQQEAPASATALNRNPWDIDVTLPVNSRRMHHNAGEYFAAHPGLEGVKGAARAAFRGVPIVGDIPRSTDAERDFSNSFPITSAAARFGLGAGAMFPPARAVGALTTRAAGTGLRPHMAAQGALGGAVNTADTFARGDENSSAIANATIGTLTGMLGPPASRPIYPAGLHPYRRPENIPRAPMGPTETLTQGLTGFGGRFPPLPNPPPVPQLNELVARHYEPQIAAQQVGKTGLSIRDGILPLIAGGIGHHITGSAEGAMYGLAGGALFNETAQRMARAVGNTAHRGVDWLASTGPGATYLGRRMSANEAAALNALAQETGLNLGREYSQQPMPAPNTLTGN